MTPTEDVLKLWEKTRKTAPELTFGPFLAGFRAAEKLILTPDPALEGSIPLVLYFGSDADVDGFIDAVNEAEPGMTARKL